MGHRFISSAVLICASFVVIGCSGSSSIAPPPESLDEFQGDWQSALSPQNTRLLVKVENDVLFYLQIREATVAVGGGTKTTVGGAGAAPMGGGKELFNVNRSETPHHIDFVTSDGPDQGKSRPGIFAFEDGKLKICVADLGEPRPTAFAPKPRTTFWVLERKP